MELWEVFSAAVAGLCIGLIGMGLTRLPKTSVAVPVHCFVLAGILWIVGDLLADTAATLAWKQVGISLLYTGAVAVPALWWVVVLRWSEEVGAELPLRSRAWTRAPLLFAVVMWTVMITNPWHGAFLTPVVGGRNLYQPLWYAMSLPCYGLIVAALAVELEVARRVSGREVRRQAFFLIGASTVTLLGNLVYVLGLVPLNVTPVVLSVSGALLLVGMSREGLFGVVPLALPAIAADHPDGLVVVGAGGHIRFANARARDLFAPIDTPIDARLVDVLRDDRLRPETPLLDESAGDEQWREAIVRPGGMTFRLNAGGHTRWLYMTATVLRGPRGGKKGIYFQISDLTTQKQAELHERQTRRLDSVAEVARTVSRDLQGIFAIVYGNSELLSAQSALTEDAQRQVARVLDAARNGMELAHELQLYTGTLSTMRVLLELSEIVEESCEFVESDLPSHVRLTFSPADELLPVHVDAFQTRHAIFNLLMNAIEAMTDVPGTIEVRTGRSRLDPANEDLVCGQDQPAGEFAYVRIRDAGVGMDPATEERAFEPFFSTRGKDRGSGLPTVLGVARAHGALLALENGEGCTFTLYFPLERSVD